MAIEINLPLRPDAADDDSAAWDASGLTEVGNESFLRAVLHDPVAFHHRRRRHGHRVDQRLLRPPVLR